MNNTNQAQPVAEKSDYELELTHLAGFGRSFDDLDQIERRQLLGKMIKAMPANEAPDLLGCFNENRSKAFANGIGEYLDTSSPIALMGAAYVMEQLWLEEYADRMRADLAAAAERLRQDLAEAGANRTSQAEFIH
jgi:hypothetical protein